MFVRLTCPECDAAIEVPDNLLGKTLRCRHCGETFRAKAPRAEADPADDDRPRRSRPRDDDRPARRGSRPERGRPLAKGRGKKRRSALPLVLGLVALVVLGGGGLAAYLLTGRGTPTDYTDPEGMFTARFPNPPEAQVVIDPAGPGPGGRVGERVAHVRIADDIYSVAVFGPFTPTATVGPRWRDQQLRRYGDMALAGGEKIADRSVAVDGHTGQLTAAFRTDGFMTVVRVVAAERYVLVAQVVAEVGTRAKAEAFVGTAEKFFDTVRVGPALGQPIDQSPAPIPADAVAAAYRADPAAADARYKDRYWDLTVRVTGLRTTNQGQVAGVESSAHGYVLEFFIPAGMDGFKPGDKLTLTGRCDGVERDRPGPPRVRFEGCQLLAPDGTIVRPGTRPPSPAVPKAVTRDPPKTPGADPPKAGSPSNPPTLTAAQRKILGTWERKISGRRLTVEFKGDGAMIEMEEGPDGTMKPKDDYKRTFRFIADKRFVQAVNGLDLFTYEVVEIDDMKMTLLHERFGSENEYTRVD